jgi:hypothetical protein
MRSKLILHGEENVISRTKKGMVMDASASEDATK